MMLGMFYGCGAGLLVGLAVGLFVFKTTFRARSFARLDISADFDDGVPEPSTGGRVEQKLKSILGFTDEWAKNPDYQRVSWFNHILKTLWPHVSKTAEKEIVAQAKLALADICTKVPLGILESVDLEVVDMGEAPIRLGGIKVYDSREDNLMTEGVLIFGSGLKLRAGIKLRVPGTGYAVYLPVEISDIQMRAVSRITLSPIVETLPCVGGVSITLLEAPYFDAAFSLCGPFDLLSLPFIHDIFQYAVKMVLESMLVYPNKMDFPVMENFGKMPPPLGMVEVTVIGAEGLRNVDLIGKSDPYVKLSVREGTVLRTRTVDNDLNPTWDQRFNLLVDDTDTQSLLMVVMDDDFGFGDTVLGVAEVDFAAACFIKTPRLLQKLTIKLMATDHRGIVKDTEASNIMLRTLGAPKILTKPLQRQLVNKRGSRDRERERLGMNGSLTVEVRYLPFVSAEALEEAALKLEEARRKAIAGAQKLGRTLTRRVTKSTLDMRGVLTVTVHRCLNLEEKSGEVDSYVRLTLYDPSTQQTSAFRTDVQLNDTSPRYDQRFDFIDVPAQSSFAATVYDKSGMLESHISLTPWKQKEDVELGFLRLNVEEVARNKVMKDMWPLLGANKGDIQLTLAFQPIIFENDDEDESDGPVIDPEAEAVTAGCTPSAAVNLAKTGSVWQSGIGVAIGPRREIVSSSELK